MASGVGLAAARHRLGGKPALHRLEQRRVENGLVLTAVNVAAVDLSFPKIMSARSDDAIQIERAPQRRSQIVERPVPAACPYPSLSESGSGCNSLNIKTVCVVCLTTRIPSD